MANEHVERGIVVGKRGARFVSVKTTYDEHGRVTRKTRVEKGPSPRHGEKKPKKNK